MASDMIMMRFTNLNLNLNIGFAGLHQLSSQSVLDNQFILF